MAKITVMGEAVVVTSATKFEDLKTIAKYRPEALVLKGGEDGKEPIFAVAVVKGHGEINKYGASFGSESLDGSKKAIITMTSRGFDGEADAKEAIADELGLAITYLNKLESTFEDVLREIESEKAAVMANITVM